MELSPPRRIFSIDDDDNDDSSIYNEEALYLAESAPGSYYATPLMSNTPRPSCPVTPSHRFRSNDAGLRSVSSTSRMDHLLATDEALQKLLSHPGHDSSMQTHLLFTENILTSIDTLASDKVSDAKGHNRSLSSSSSSRHVSRVPSGPLADASSPSAVPRVPSYRDLVKDSTPLPPASPSASRPRRKARRPAVPAPASKPIGTGRPRKRSMKAASLALNEAFKAALPTIEGLVAAQPRVLKCPIHGEGCDGVSVAKEHRTEEKRRRGGFKDVYPMITSQGRTMVDWAVLMSEEKEKMGREEE